MVFVEANEFGCNLQPRRFKSSHRKMRISRRTPDGSAPWAPRPALTSVATHGDAYDFALRAKNAGPSRKEEALMVFVEVNEFGCNLQPRRFKSSRRNMRTSRRTPDGSAPWAPRPALTNQHDEPRRLASIFANPGNRFFSSNVHSP